MTTTPSVAQTANISSAQTSSSENLVEKSSRLEINLGWSDAFVLAESAKSASSSRGHSSGTKSVSESEILKTKIGLAEVARLAGDILTVVVVVVVVIVIVVVVVVAVVVVVVAAVVVVMVAAVKVVTLCLCL
jgi:hypothetical protein